SSIGAIERIVAFLIEHYAGAFPFWLAPIQTAILTINDRIEAYAQQIIKELETRGIRTALDVRNESIGKKIREAEMQKIPYLLILGPEEARTQTLAARAHGKGDIGKLTLDTFLEKIKEESITSFNSQKII
ncbi:MAG: threonyl-tRNA synthetase, partial [Parcubacteria group bacterium Gr01-1014_66]